MALEVILDGVDVSDVVQEAWSHHWLNRKYFGTVRIPVAQAFLPSEGARMKITDPDLAGLGLNPIDHHGTVKFVSAEDGTGGDDEGICEITSESAREIWEHRRARNGPATSDPGNYIKPTFFDELLSGPQIIEDVLTQSIDGSDPALGEGDMACALGSFEAGGISLAGTPMATPLSIEELANLLASTGEVDIVETMIDSAGDMSQIDAYNGAFGDNLSTTFEYVYEENGTARGVKFTYDASKLANKIRYLLAPRVTDTRWRRSIEATNVDIPDTSTYTQAALVAAITASRSTWLVRDDVRIYDQFGREADAVPLYWRLWQDESLWRLQPRKLYTIFPREGELPGYDIGDVIGVGAHAGFMGGFSGEQRIFGRRLHWDVNGVVSVTELQTSADGDTLA